MDLIAQYLYAPVVAALGVALAVFLLVRDLRRHERPATSLAWLVSIIVLPYIAAPAYFFFGTRKLRKVVRGKLAQSEPDDADADSPELSGVLRAFGLPPARSGNACELIADGAEAWQTWVRLIDEAEHSIRIMTFILGTDAVGRAIAKRLERKAREGVEVCVLVDALGSWKARLFLLRRLRRAGVRVGVFMPALTIWRRHSANLRNHRKIAIFDGRVAVTGGRNLAAEYLARSRDETVWADSITVCHGPVVRDLDRVLVRDWQFATDEQLEVTDRTEARAGKSVLQVAPGGPDVEGDPLYDIVTLSFNRARRRIWICTPYFVPDAGLMRVLSMLARAGVDVRVFVPRRSDSRIADLVRDRLLRRLLAAGVTVLADPGPMLHAKHLLVDDAVAITGSTNMDMRSLYLNFEVSLLGYSDDVREQTEAFFEDLAERCETYDVPERSFVRGWCEDLCWLTSPLL